ncbi:hypothetical protein [Microbacterium thalli]|uniref:hypothetical protein n=1 Tax=Microbacterium thalli TaxID=3027921 RepID=UPI002366A2C3|nr:hypothetical protein [Microbacterium thalli]MDD7930088.1 hypothetical protein [Microbacterium thalli]
MYAFLASAIPSAAALLVGAWLLIEQIDRKIRRGRLVGLIGERDAIYARHRDGRPPAEYEDAEAEAKVEYEELLRAAGVNPKRLHDPSFGEWTADLVVGNTLPWSEVTRQLILIVGAIVGIVFLGLDLASRS